MSEEEIQRRIDAAIRDHEIRFSLWGAAVAVVGFAVEGVIELIVQGRL